MPSMPIKPKPIDLVPRNPSPLLLKLENTKVDVDVRVETKKPNSAKADRLTKVAEAEMQRYQSIVQSTIDKVTKEWDNMPLPERRKQAETLSRSVENACKSMEAAIGNAVSKQLAREAPGDKNLLEARVFVVAKIGMKIIAIGKDIVEVGGSAGVNIKALYSLAKDLWDAANLVLGALQKEPALRKSLLDSIGAYSTLKQRRWNEAKKAVDWKAKAKLTAKNIWASESSMAKKAEVARKAYRNEITAMIQRVDEMGQKADKLAEALKKSGDINAKSIATGSDMMNLKKSVGEVNSNILEGQGFADDMAFLLTEAGVDVDDRTEAQKFTALANLGDVQKAGKEIKSAVENLKKIIESFKN